MTSLGNGLKKRTGGFSAFHEGKTEVRRKGGTGGIVLQKRATYRVAVGRVSLMNRCLLAGTAGGSTLVVSMLAAEVRERIEQCLQRGLRLVAHC